MKKEVKEGYTIICPSGARVTDLYYEEKFAWDAMTKPFKSNIEMLESKGYKCVKATMTIELNQ